MSLQWKMQTNFPFSRVFVLGAILFFLGLASMIIAIIACVTLSWGYYVGTGLWGGATVLASGITAVFVSRLRTLASVKTFCVCSLAAMFTSLTMLILSAGGLTLNSGFYGRVDLADYNKRTSNLIHASLLVISVFCLSGSVLAVIVCCKYIFFEHYNRPKHRRHHRNMSDSTVRSCSALRGGTSNHNSQRPSNSRTTLHSTERISRRHSDIVDVNRVQIEYRRSHKRSASDQPHNFHSRRQKHGHLNINHASGTNSNNALVPNCVRYYPDRRSGNNRNSNHGIELRGNVRETERQNTTTSRPGPSRPVSQIHMQPRTSSSPVSTSPKVRLPTEFNEEELPPYEAVEASANVNNSSHSDSGDESDTENSSSTDAHSYVAQDEEGMEAIPMVQIQSQENQYFEENSRQHKTTNLSSHERSQSNDNNLREHQSCAVLSCSDHAELVINETSCDLGAVSSIMKNNQNKSIRPLSGYRHSQSSYQGDSEHLLSVSPEVCAITGESPEPTREHNGRVPHIIQENYYENGPCYENVRCGGKIVAETSLNHLSKSSSGNFTEIANAKSSLKEKETNCKSSFSAKTVLVQVITQSSPISNTSPQSPLSTFGSPMSAFRPVGAAFSALSPENNCSSATHSVPFPRSNSDDYSPQNEIPEVCHKSHNLSVHRCITEKSSDITSNPSSAYFEQGAIPKILKHKEKVPVCNNNTSMSWKNIPLPLSYNHSESASNESEKKLPSKTIPLADSDPDISRKNETPAKTSFSSRLSSHIYPSNLPSSSSVPLYLSQASAHAAVELPISPFGAAAEALLAVSTKWNAIKNSQTSDTQSQQPNSSAVNEMGTSVASVREASTQVNTGSSSHWHSHRMGGNQSLIQSRRDELHNCQLSNSTRSMEMSSRVARPTSLLALGTLSSISNAISVRAVDRQSRSRSNEASSFFANHQGQNQQSQSLTLRQNHLLQHYPLQPQQPRLGVQLHHRRQQQNQLQQNIESQQHHQQMQQQQQLVQQPQQDNQQNLQAQQGRNGRPLFSVLL